MGKYVGKGVKPGVNKSGGGEVDWELLSDYAEPKADVEQATSQVVEDTLASPGSGIQEIAEMRGQSPSVARQEIADDPVQYEAFQESYGQPIGQGVGVGTGVGYSQDKNIPANEVSKISLINTMQARLNADPMDVQARETLLSIAPEFHSQSGTLDQGREEVDTPGQKRPGIRRSPLTPDQRLDKIRVSYDKGREVQKILDERSFNMTNEEIRSASAKVIAHQESNGQKKITPDSMNEVFQLFMSTNADISEADGNAPSALADLGLHAVMLEAKNELAREAKAEDKRNFKGWDPADVDQFTDRSKQGKQGAIGRLMEGAMGVKGDKAVTNAIGGYFQHIVEQAYPHMFENGKLKREYFDEANELSEMTAIILPSSQLAPRHAAKVNLDGTPKKSRITGPRGSEVNKDHGDQEFNNKTRDTLESTPVAVSQDFRKIVEQLAGVIDKNGETSIDVILEITAIEDESGNKVKGTLNNRDDSSRRFVRDGKGNKIPDPERPGKFKTKAYLGNKVKDHKYNQTMDWMATETGSFFYDYFTAGNGRWFVQQTIGNFQSDKLSRAGLMSAQAEVYDISDPDNQDTKNIKAGIAKKSGHDDKGVNAAAVAFDKDVKKWVKYIDKDGNVIDGQGLIDAVDENNGGEGWMHVSAIVEGVKLFHAIADGKAQYKSSFYTEIDGVANGLGHGAMQAGDIEVARRTNLFGKNGEQDVYEFVGDNFASSISSHKNPVIRQIAEVLGFAGDNKHNLRSFSKKPVMIFGYGAGDITIKEVVADFIADELSKDHVVSAKFAELIADSGMTEKKVLKVLQAAMVKSVHSSFKDVKELSSLMSSLTQLAIDQGIDPGLATVGGHKIWFGYRGSERDTDKDGNVIGFTDKDTGVVSAPTRTKIEPGTRMVKREGTYDRKARPGETVTRETKDGREFQAPAGSLKASTQSAVLPTHNNDGINIGMTFNELIKKDVHTGVQVFDGILTTPKRAKATAIQLNKDFYKINIARSNLQRMMLTLREQGFNWSTPKGKKLRRRIDKLEKKRIILLERLRSDMIKQFFWD